MMNKKTNILIFKTDQQRYDSLGCTGNDYAVTPCIDQLAQEGSTMHRYIVANPVCMPSRASFMSGRYPCATGVTSNGIPLPRNSALKERSNNEEVMNSNCLSHVPTTADIFKENGYQTCSIGKLHHQPWLAPGEFGFEESLDTWKDKHREEWTGPYYGFDHVELAISHGENIEGHYAAWLKKQYPNVYKAIRNGDHRKNPPFREVKDLYPSIIPEEAHQVSQ